MAGVKKTCFFLGVHQWADKEKLFLLYISLRQDFSQGSLDPVPIDLGIVYGKILNKTTPQKKKLKKKKKKKKTPKQNPKQTNQPNKKTNPEKKPNPQTKKPQHPPSTKHKKPDQAQNKDYQH